MKRLTVDTNLLFCDIAKCRSTPRGSFCEDGYCDQRRVYERLREYEDTGLEPEEIVSRKELDQLSCVIDLLNNCQQFNESIDRLRELAEADKEGRCVVLPCKPSDVTIYQLRNKKHARGIGVSPRHVMCTQVWSGGGYSLQHQGQDSCCKKDFGKTWFLTREEAAAAQKEGGEHDGN